MPPETTQRRASTLSRILRRLGMERGLDLTEIMTLLTVAEAPGLSPTDLSRLCGYTLATGSRTARSLMSLGEPGALAPYHGLLLMRRGPNDKKRRHLFLTRAGRDLCRAIDDALAGTIAPILTLDAEAICARVDS